MRIQTSDVLLYHDMTTAATDTAMTLAMAPDNTNHARYVIDIHVQQGINKDNF